jgi:ABC-2 type transport system permease protein
MLPERAIVKHVLAHELRAGRRGAVLWWLSIGGMLALVCALQPALAAGPLAAKIASMPAAMRAAFGMTIVDFERPAAYLAANFMYIALGVAVFGGLAGARVIAKEELLHTAELLYVQPSTRTAILVGKALAVATYALALPAALAVVPLAILGALVERPLEPVLIASLFVACAFLALACAGLGMLVAASLRQPRAAANATLGLVFGAFMLGVLSVLAPGLAFLRWVSPFKLLEAPHIVAAGGPAPLVLIGLLVFGVGAAAAAIRIYQRKDLHA